METESSTRSSGEKLMIVVVFTLVLSSMSATMFNIVLPELSREFAMSYAQVSWVSTAYLLIYAIGSAIYGKLADMFRLKQLIACGLLCFMAGSLIGLAAQSYAMVLLGRIVQAAGAAVIPATAMIIPVRYFPPERRGRALGMAATGLAIGGAIGPIVTALLVSLVDWRWLFCVPLLLLLTLPFYRKYLGDERGPGGRIDWIGGALLAGAVTLFLLAVTMGNWLLGAGSLLLLLLFAAHIRRAAEPFVSPHLFRNGNYTFGLMLSVLVMGIGYSLLFLTPQLLAEVNQLDAGWIGFAMVPAAAVSALLGRKAGKIADTRGNPTLFGLASALLISAFALLSVFAGAAPEWIAVLLIAGQVGQMFMQIALNNTVSRTLPREQTGVGMGLLSMLSFLSGASAAAIYSSVVDLGAGVPLNPLNPFAEAAVFSNVYLVLALLHVGILALYLARFGRAVQPRQPERAKQPQRSG
ncbi:MFS transporter [Brevibacillus marinus]|uniref:MFS transporter n=1 Tax=Brevibacillus marinus TaxID=2496837 RepID=UPI000F84D42A|nr:MFS transporter [Brevibacillus marinus]